MYKKMEPLTDSEQQTVNDNIGLVVFYVSRWRKIFNNESSNDDIYQCAMMGLMRAVKTWNPEVASLSTYCRQWIERSIESYYTTDHTIKPSERRAIDSCRIRKKMAADPTLTTDSPEIRKCYQNVSGEYIRKLLSENIWVNVSSLDNPGIGPVHPDDPASDRHERIPSDEPTPEEISLTGELTKMVIDNIDRIPLKEVKRYGNVKLPPDIKRLVIKEYYINERSYQDIGIKYGVSRERIRQIKEEALDDLRKMFLDI